MQILDGRLVAQETRAELKRKIHRFFEQNKQKPGLAVVLVGNNPASKIYVRQKIKAAEEVGISSEVFSFSGDVPTHELERKIQNLNRDSSVHAILVQLPLPSAFSSREVVSWIDPKKDPDCLTVENQGLAWSSQPRVLPCTPSGVMKLFEYYNIPLQGKKAVVVGRSQIVGLPMAQLLLRANATVTICHSHTKELSLFTKEADIIVVAAGRPGLLGGSDFKKEADVVDVGIHRTTEQGKSVLSGDVRFKEIQDQVSFATPVPGGVGPMTVAMLLENTFHLACLNTGKTNNA